MSLVSMNVPLKSSYILDCAHLLLLLASVLLACVARVVVSMHSGVVSMRGECVVSIRNESSECCCEHA